MDADQGQISLLLTTLIPVQQVAEAIGKKVWHE